MQNWQQTHNNLILTGLGSQDLLAQPLRAFFASRQWPGTAIRSAMTWTLQQVKEKRVIISGFHSPLEQAVLKILMQAKNPVVLVLARPSKGAKLSAECLAAIDLGHLTVISSSLIKQRLTNKFASQRNELVASLASDITVAYASQNGELITQCKKWINHRPIQFLQTD
jgi:predicted Rossmann fold nucleotide-binding protein DprA/Smf involved in DNA uptake